MQRDPGSSSRRNWFDPTINLGHVLTFSGMAAALFLSWNQMDKRVAAMEMAHQLSQQHQRERDSYQDNAVAGKFSEVREALVEVKHSINELRREQNKLTR